MARRSKSRDLIPAPDAGRRSNRCERQDSADRQRRIVISVVVAQQSGERRPDQGRQCKGCVDRAEARSADDMVDSANAGQRREISLSRGWTDHELVDRRSSFARAFFVLARGRLQRRRRLFRHSDGRAARCVFRPRRHPKPRSCSRHGGLVENKQSARSDAPAGSPTSPRIITDSTCSSAERRFRSGTNSRSNSMPAISASAKAGSTGPRKVDDARS
jgi:hypothetical protein